MTTQIRASDFTKLAAIIRPLSLWLSHALPAMAQTGEYLGFTYEAEGTNVTITGYNSANYSVPIPGTIAGKSVTAIGDSAFAYSGWESVALPHSVTCIGTKAFADFSRQKPYTIQSADRLGGAWQADATVIASEKQTRVVLNRPATPRFYQLTIQP